MEDLVKKISVPTKEITSELIQELLINAKRSKKENVTDDIWDEICQILWQHLQLGLQKFDDQLLCATCFYAVLPLSKQIDFYINQIIGMIREEQYLKEKEISDQSNTSQVVSLMYGSVQSSFLLQVSRNKNIDNFLQTMMELLSIMAYEYSKFTFIVFKTMSSFKKLCGTDLENVLFNNDNQMKLLNLVNHNWENPITGVRDLNKIIFQTLISVIDIHMYDGILEEINRFYWSKAKYLMISEIVRLYRGNITYKLMKYDWVEGLLTSLHKPGLVSAGADMYYAILEKLRSEAEWIAVFLQQIINILSGESEKAIENFNNYWCIATFKRFPLLAKILIDELVKLDASKQKLFSVLFVLKQALKLGLYKNITEDHFEWKLIKEMVLIGLEHCNTDIRILSFEIICVSQHKSMPTEMEYELVLKFLYHNINTDCTVLRLSMLKSFSYFLTQIYVSYLNYLKSYDHDMKNLKEFCSKFQAFITNSLDINGNYQRKITSIKLANVFINGLSEIPRKRQKQTKQSNVNVIAKLKAESVWQFDEEKFTRKLLSLLNDPADDVRENIIQILNHSCYDMTSTQILNDLIEDALKSMKSKFFYKISCGQSMFKLIINILLKETHSNAMFKNVQEIFDFAVQELVAECKFKKGIVESIEDGKQLHSFISILQIVLEICLQNAYTIVIDYRTLLGILEEISNQFAWESGTTSSDFSKMSDMVQTIITQSGYNPCDENDQTKISGLHQIVLNCLWLNVKASCELSALLIKYQKEAEQIGVCEKCLDIITHVLETCRHKGAIEAGGASLGQAIQHLTSLPEYSVISSLPYSLLERKLKELISEAGKMSSVTRRGAGLSIMVHRIVSSDAKKGKPLFHYFMKTLLETCTTTDDIPQVSETESIDNVKDLPKAIYIHFLTRIVTDSSLASDMMFYSAQLAELAFGNLTSPHWQIRNAALQLYGALIQKLIGQKKASGTDDETVATVACDELRTHSPKMWKYIQLQLRNTRYTNKLQHHSNLIPILNMLANIAKRYNFAYDLVEQKESDEQMFKSLLSLLGSPIFTVRRLTAKCIFNMYSFETIYNALMTQERFTENFLHGSLMMTKNCHKYYSSGYKQQFEALKVKFLEVLCVVEHSYLCKELFEGMFDNCYCKVELITQTLSELNTEVHKPGIFLWANLRTQKFVTETPWESMTHALKIILEQNHYENYLQILLQKIQNDNCIPRKILLEINDVLLAFDKRYQSGLIWKILYNISLKTDLAEHVDLSSIFKYIEENGVSYRLRYMMPLLTRLSVNNLNEVQLLKLSKIIHCLANFENTDTDMRYIAALANNEFAVKNAKEPVKINAIKTAIILLQDEDEDIRNMSIHFYKNLSDTVVSLHPYICLLDLLNYEFLVTVLSKPGIEILCMDLSQFLQSVSCDKSVDEYNPFANDSKNIYLEVEVLQQLINKLQSSLV